MRLPFRNSLSLVRPKNAYRVDSNHVCVGVRTAVHFSAHLCSDFAWSLSRVFHRGMSTNDERIYIVLSED